MPAPKKQIGGLKGDSLGGRGSGGGGSGKPLIKVQPKPNAKVASPKSNVKVVSSKLNSNVKVITNSTAKKQELYQDWLKTFGPAKNKALANSAKGKTQTPTAEAARRRNINK